MSLLSTPQDPDAAKRQKVMLAVAGGVLVLALAFWFVLKPVLLKNSSDTASAAPIPTHHSSKPTTTPTPSDSSGSLPLPAPAGGDSARDPFDPLPQEASASAAPTAVPTAAPAAAPTDASAVAPAGATGSTAGTSSTGGTTISLVSISGETAQLAVNGKTTTVKPGDSPAAGVSVLKVDPDAVILSQDNKLYALAQGQSQSF